jgi:uncharacterized membrane-anchored protein
VADRIRQVILILGAVLILVLTNLQILGKEAVVRDGRTVLLQLEPIDPRSLIQGDYMALRYAISGDVAAAAENAGRNDGYALITLDPVGAAAFAGLYEGQMGDRDQVLLRFRKRGESVRLASDAYFFEEGEWQTYENARFGELRVDAKGEAVLTALRDDELRVLGSVLHDFQR